MQCFYFGCWSKSEAGHYLYSPSGSRSYRSEKLLPFAIHILDSGLLPPKEPEVEGRIHHNVINGWTVLSFWDRSGDSRPASNSSFIIEGVFSTADGLKISREQFPTVFERFTFPLVDREGA